MVRNQLKTPRTSREMSQGQVAIAGGVSRQAIYVVENERSDPSLAFGLARLFRRPIEEVFHDLGSPPTSGQGNPCTALLP
ncbi:helix-turn-helix transcriptional regulator [Kocuria sp. CPCC 205300]|uniref:helix-turn-helix transcriptional regulator n=1 Tax=Kocuria sabuli TaxID=3071448 RepID=UPI0036DD9442